VNDYALSSALNLPHQKGFGRLSAEDKAEIDWAM
ncbi:hypothetical protein SS7213T_03570, partial [Staphylococcus simiae CCM 7213 = CCUG 51256]